jgi:hypothetical protein
MNRRYALIALDRRHECADFPGCDLALRTPTAQWSRGSRENKVMADPNMLHFARLSSDSRGRTRPSSIWKTDA